MKVLTTILHIVLGISLGTTLSCARDERLRSESEDANGVTGSSASPAKRKALFVELPTSRRFTKLSLAHGNNGPEKVVGLNQEAVQQLASARAGNTKWAFRL